MTNRPAPLQCSICGAPLKAGDMCGEIITPDGEDRLYLCEICWSLDLELQRVARRNDYRFDE